MRKLWHKIKYNKLTFFLSLVWRKCDSDPRCTKIDIKTAWEVAKILTAPWKDSIQNVIDKHEVKNERQ